MILQQGANLLSSWPYDAVFATIRQRKKIDREFFETRLRRLGISQRGLAKLMGVDASALNKIFRGTREIKVDELKRLAAVLQIPLTDAARHFGDEPIFEKQQARIVGYVGQDSREPAFSDRRVAVLRAGRGGGRGRP